MLTIPEGVSQHLVEKLEAYQKQIHVLLRNHQILSYQAKKFPDDSVLQNHIKAIQNYLLKFSNEQKPIIEQIRAEVKLLNLSNQNLITTSLKNELSDNEIPSNETSRDSNLTSKSEKDVSKSNESKSPTCDDGSSLSGVSGDNKSPGYSTDSDTKSTVSIKPKTSIKDRMAIVRAMRRRKKKTTAGGLPKPRSGPATRTPSPKTETGVNDDHCNDESYLDSIIKGHVSQVEKLVYPEIPKAVEDCNDPIEIPMSEIDQCNKETFLVNLGLLTPSEEAKVCEHRHEYRKRKFDYRNLTFIPEISDKKHRISYNYLSADLNSPPLLRTRQRRPPIHVSASTWIRPTSARAISHISRSASVSRSSTPDIDMSLKRRVVSPIAMLPAPASPAPPTPTSTTTETGATVKGEEKEEVGQEDLLSTQTDMESETKDSKDLDEKYRLKEELSNLDSKAKEVEKALGESSNRRTVATRKERNRLSDLQVEQTKIEREKNKIKKRLQALGTSKK